MRDAKPRGYKSQANARPIAEAQGLSDMYQPAVTETDRYQPVWNKFNQLCGVRNITTGKFTPLHALPGGVLPAMADVPNLFAEDGANRTAKGKRGKVVEVRKVRTTERHRSRKAQVGESLAQGNLYQDKLIGYTGADAPQELKVMRHRAHRHVKGTLSFTDEQITVTSSRGRH